MIASLEPPSKLFRYLAHRLFFDPNPTATVDVETEMEAEEAVLDAMLEIRRRSQELRHYESEYPHCGGDFLEAPEEDDPVDVPEDLVE